jgi:hypothetical protein
VKPSTVALEAINLTICTALGLSVALILGTLGLGLLGAILR